MDGEGRECLEHILEVERLRTNIGHIRVDSREGIGRVESGTETEKMSGTYFPDKVEARCRYRPVPYKILCLIRKFTFCLDENKYRVNHEINDG